LHFTYQVSDVKGRIEQGSTAAESREQLLFNLKSQGKYVLEIKEESEIRSRLKKGRLSKQDRLNFTQQLAGLLESGIPLEKSLGIMTRLRLRPELSEIVVQLRRHIQEGLSFSAALERHSGLFPPLYINLVKAGEAGGILPVVLKRLAVYLEEEISLRRFMPTLLLPVSPAWPRSLC
jgi:type II secretory pathway component PulF